VHVEFRCGDKRQRSLIVQVGAIRDLGYSSKKACWATVAAASMVVIVVAGVLGKTVNFWIADAAGAAPGLVAAVAAVAEAVAVAVAVAPLPTCSRARMRLQYFVGHKHGLRPCAVWLVKKTSRREFQVVRFSVLNKQKSGKI
jgi:anti-sigma-K factor RskA